MADIHGNLTALKAVLKELNNHKIDKIIVAGDHITDCPSPNEVLDIIKGKNFICIKGNREDYIKNLINSPDLEKFNQLLTIKWTCEQLTKSNLNWIYNLPSHRVIEFETLDNIFVVHGTPDNLSEHLIYSEEKRLLEIIDKIEEKIVVCGHSHRPHIVQFKDKFIINPGSVGVSFNKETVANFSIITWVENKWEIEQLEATYNINELKNEFLSSGLWNYAHVWSKLVFNSIKDGYNYNVDFINSFKSENYIPNNEWDIVGENYIKKFLE